RRPQVYQAKIQFIFTCMAVAYISVIALIIGSNLGAWVFIWMIVKDARKKGLLFHVITMMLQKISHVYFSSLLVGVVSCFRYFTTRFLITPYSELISPFLSDFFTYDFVN